MIHVRFSLSWLILPLLASLSFLAIGEPLDGAAQALHLIGYIGADYPATVVDGQVVDASEYQEQLEFLDVLQGLIIALPAQAGRAELEQDVSNLHQAITQRQSGDEVASAARALGARLAEFYQVSLTPVLTPDPQRGAPLYAQHCSVCHGDTGLGDGPAGIGLEPAPANLRDTARMDRLSLYDLYNTLGLGIEGTDMPAFADQLDERQRWDLASYIASFTATAAQGQARFAMSELAGRTPAEIAAAGGDVAAFRAQRAHPLLEQRGPQQLIGYTRATLERSLQAYRDGDREQAYDLSVGAYLEGFELLESALDNLDAVQRKTTERALMAYRQALQDGASVGVAAQALEQVKIELDKSATLLADGAMDDSLSFFASLLILLREGLEAILVLAAILAFLRNTGQQQAVRSVHIGWGLALLAGVATWAVAAYLIDISGAQRELLEGATALFASVVLLWVGVWMHDRRHAAAWQDYIKSSLVGGGGRFGFAVLAFFSVYRELFEVILFYETLWLQAGPAGHGAVLAGAAAALVLLLGLAWVILRGSRKLPLATFFGINAVLLCVLSVVFAGHGVVALQEAGMLGTRPVAFFEFDWLGIHADAWSLTAQGLALTGIALLYGRSLLGERRRLAEQG
ncbi:FTR1 family protein [Pseudomonas sp. GD03721]|nr:MULTISPECIES: cytochrome c/FTR1 family iron permease [unclassified Pseudomonas]MDH1441506.1 FTR1 family protein [Pseudomonas sp. GD03722]WGG01385.1 FTR1 family protein [Pseudomonas sp. GD03721]WGG05553.1 FTR1 family protein [Pseudomonas sp. GD03919]